MENENVGIILIIQIEVKSRVHARLKSFTPLTFLIVLYWNSIYSGFLYIQLHVNKQVQIKFISLKQFQNAGWYRSVWRIWDSHNMSFENWPN